MTQQKIPGVGKMTIFEQLKVILKVAKLSFKIAPVAVMFKFAGAVFDALLPFVTTYFAALTTTTLVAAYNGELNAQNNVILYVLITSGLGLFTISWHTIDNYIQESMRYRVETKVSYQMYEHFLSLDFWRYDDKETADLYDKAQRFSQFFAWIFDKLASTASQFITMIAGVFALFFVNGWMAFFVLIAIIPGVYLQLKLSRMLIKHWNSNVDTRRTKNMIEWELIQPSHITELRLYGIVRYLLDLRQKLCDIDEKARIDFEKKFIAKRLLSDALQTIAELGSLIWITFEIIAKRQPIGQFIYVQQVVSRAISGSSSFISQLSNINEDVSNLFYYEEFMRLGTSYTDSKIKKSDAKIIKLENISFHYPEQKKNVLKNISFSIEKNQHIAIVGENGAGKTTLIKLIAGLYAPTKGDIKIDDINLQDIDITSWHKQLSILKQDYLSYNFTTVRDNVLFGDIDKHDKKQFKKALDDAEATDFTSKLPNGLDTYLNNWMDDEEGNSGTNLSGGQWQRLALARNFYRDTPIIILDEPTSAIDALAESRIFSRLLKEKNKTIITISHRLTTIEKADIIYLIENGEIVEQGSHNELVATRGKYYRMFESQLHKSEI